MYIPRLIHTIALEQRPATTDTFGEQDLTWPTFMSGIPAKVAPISGREVLASGEIASEITHRVVMRYVSGVSADMRVNFNGRYFAIKAILDEEERNEKLTLMCAEGLSDA